jgi:flagellar hook-length control protein FliK
VRRFENGATRFELRLDPPELGRIEVRLDVSRDHRVTAVIAADSPQALTELARHARDLEHMLQGAGLELTENGLSFDLRQGGERAEAAEFGGAITENATHVDDPAPVAARPLGYESWRGVRVDMMV